MRLIDLQEAAAILIKYYDDPRHGEVAAEHDQILFYSTDKPVSEMDRKRLKELGLVQDQMPGEAYNIENGWHVWV